MTHIDEHTLELFVLGAKEVQRKRKAIEAHLRKCEGCRTLVRTMTNYYANADAHLKSQPETQTQLHPQALIRPRAEVEPAYDPYYSTFKTPVPVRMPKTFLQHVYSYAKQNPIRSVVGSFAFIAGLGLLLNLTLKTVLKDTNPAYTLMSTSRSALEVYNRGDELLWQLPVASISDWSEREALRIHDTRVMDLNGDGRNEVVTILPSPSADNHANSLRVYDGKKNILLVKTLRDTTINFLTNHYEASLLFSDLVAADYQGSGKQEIITGVGFGRSPWHLVRLDHTLGTIGTYWHFGFNHIYQVHLDGSGREEVVLCGVNQVDEPKSGQLAEITVLDPTRIVGNTEAASTHGFGFQPSNAELFCVKIPENDMQKALGLKQNMPALLSSENELQFSVNSTSPDGPHFEFVFTKDMYVKEVKFGSQDVWIHAKLKKDGKIRSTFGQQYLEDLKNAVRYWDGKEWRKEWTKVRHDSAFSP